MTSKLSSFVTRSFRASGRNLTLALSVILRVWHVPTSSNPILEIANEHLASVCSDHPALLAPECYGCGRSAYFFPYDHLFMVGHSEAPDKVWYHTNCLMGYYLYRAAGLPQGIQWSAAGSGFTGRLGDIVVTVAADHDFYQLRQGRCPCHTGPWHSVVSTAHCTYHLRERDAFYEAIGDIGQLIRGEFELRERLAPKPVIAATELERIPRKVIIR